MIATEMLNTLLYRILEIYIDDVNIFENSPGDFVARLREFISRICLHKMVLKPSKCYLGYADLQFVGKVISQCMCTVGGRIGWIVTRSGTARRPGIPGTTTFPPLISFSKKSNL